MNSIAVHAPTNGMTTSARMNALVPTSMGEAMHLAEIMSQANLLPDHLRGKPGDCLLVVMQAQRWGMDPVSVAQCTSVVRGKLCYEGKLVAAALYATGSVEGRIKYAYSGTGRARKVVVSAVPRGEDDAVSVEGTVEQWATDNKNWTANPDDMLAYRGARQWARRHAPEALLGVYTPDELDEIEPTRATVVSVTPVEYGAEDFERNLSAWLKAIEAGRRSVEDIIAMAETKGRLSDEQKKRIRDGHKPVTAEETEQ
ncbi:hypothetical protein GCM10009552_15530 [Rothia nasimurium]|nr:recombinase RecT [Luteibacter anthropi]